MLIKNKILNEYLYITIGTILLSIAITLFYDPYGIITGGVTGLGIIIATLSESYLDFTIPLWATNLAFNVPLLIFSVKLQGFNFLIKTLYSTLLFSFSLYFVGLFFENINTEFDFILISIYGGLLSGVSLGLVFKGFGSTGGTDLLAVVLNKKFKHISVSKLILLLDGSIVLLGLFVFGSTKTMYAIITIFIATKTISAILEGLGFAKAVFIISDKNEEISKEIINTVKRGVTSLRGKGVYTSNERSILLTCVKVKEIVILKELIYKIDNRSFLIITDAREVLGEGFENFD